MKGSSNSAIARHVMLTVTWGPRDNGSPNLIRQIRAATVAEAMPGAKEQLALALRALACGSDNKLCKNLSLRDK